MYVHPHTIGDDACTWFDLNPSGAQVVSARAVTYSYLSQLFGGSTMHVGLILTERGGGGGGVELGIKA